MMKKHSGVTLVELLFVLVILGMLMAAVFKLTISGQKSAVDIMSSHVANEEIQRLTEMISDDIKEANYLDDPAVDDASHRPPLIDLGASTLEDALKEALTTNKLRTDDEEKNQIVLRKYVPQKPNLPPANAKEIFKRYQISYMVKKDPSNSNLCALVREFAELRPDSNDVIPESVSKKTLIEGLDIRKNYIVFFRLKNSGGAISARNIFFAADIFREERKSSPNDPPSGKPLFHSSVLTAAHIRGSTPDFL